MFQQVFCIFYSRKMLYSIGALRLSVYFDFFKYRHVVQDPDVLYENFCRSSVGSHEKIISATLVSHKLIFMSSYNHWVASSTLPKPHRSKHTKFILTPHNIAFMDAERSCQFTINRQELSSKRQLRRHDRLSHSPCRPACHSTEVFTAELEAPCDTRARIRCMERWCFHMQKERSSVYCHASCSYVLKINRICVAVFFRRKRGLLPVCLTNSRF
jgi:hypothetical protein